MITMLEVQYPMPCCVAPERAGAMNPVALWSSKHQHKRASGRSLMLPSGPSTRIFFSSTPAQYYVWLTESLRGMESVGKEDGAYGRAGKDRQQNYEYTCCSINN